MTPNHERFVRDWHAAACAAARHFDRVKDETLCANCNRPRKNHKYEELACTLYVTSTKYRAANREEVEKTTKTIECLEQLAAIRGWDLTGGAP